MVILAIGTAPTGCGSKAAPVDTGAREVVQGYFEAVLKQDCDLAHGLLDADSQRRFPRPNFAALVKKYGELGFEPQSIKIRSCDEQGDRAIAHVSLIGKSAGKERRYRDAVSMQKTESGWRVILPKNLDRY